MRSLLNRKKFSKFHQTLSRFDYVADRDACRTAHDYNHSTGSRFSTLSKGRQTLSEQSESKGFTIVELIVVISIIGILAAIGIVSYNGWRQSTNVTQLKSDLNGVAAAMENARTFGDAYPTSVPSTFTSSRGVTFIGGSTDGGETYCVTAFNSQFPTVYYHIDSTNASQGAQLGECQIELVVTIAGTGGTAEQSGSGSYSLNDTPTITATANTGYTFTSWSGSNGCSGNAVHPITMNASKSCTANFTPNAYTLTYTAGTGGTITGTTLQSVIPGASGTAVTATPLNYFEFVNWDDNSTTNPRTDINVNANKSVTANFTATAISAPAALTVTPSTTGATTTYSWGAASCGANTARYQYRITINSTPTPYDSGLIATTATSVDYTTSTEGLTYTIAVQAQCYNTATTSGWSTAGSGNYYRPYTYTLTLTAGTGGTVSQSGTSPYTAGATPTITASPSTNYSFASWTGTNCTGASSHAIPAIAANMSCTANFSKATGGVITYSGGYTIHTFNSSGTFTPNTALSVEVLVVGGGGGGGSSSGSGGGGGGGGAGGLTYNSSFSITTQSYSVTVGDGGAPGGTSVSQPGSNGNNSIIGSITVTGGGGGAGEYSNGVSGGSGGGAGFNGYSLVRTGGGRVAGQGNAGGSTTLLSWAGGAGGGGAGGAGGTNKINHEGGDGGLGLSYSISGSSVTYSIGGNGGSFNKTASPNNTGKGGDAAYATAIAYAGGSGVVIIRYPT